MLRSIVAPLEDEIKSLRDQLKEATCEQVTSYQMMKMVYFLVRLHDTQP